MKSISYSAFFVALPAARRSFVVIGLHYDTFDDSNVMSEEMLQDVRDYIAALDLKIDIPVDCGDLQGESSRGGATPENSPCTDSSYSPISKEMFVFGIVGPVQLIVFKSIGILWQYERKQNVTVVIWVDDQMWGN